MMDTNPRSKRHQSTPACARCNKLKQKCDRGTPRCRRCVAAGTDCMAVNRETSAHVPRSLIQHLEQRLAELQRDGPAANESNGSGGNGTPASNDQSHSLVLELAALAITNRLTPCLFESEDKIQHRAKLFYPSERPPLKIPVRGVYHDVRPRTAGRIYAPQSSHFKAQNIPPHVATRLFKNYKDEILPRFPCFLEEDLANFFNQFYNEASSEGSPAQVPGFAVPMILAISSLTSNSHDFPKVAALSESLYADAMRHVGVLQDSSIPSLQCMLLLIQLGLILPYTSNSWYMTGEAMRMAVSLGLHQEPDLHIIPDENHAELRRRLFWTIYQLDRTVGIAGGCPVALSDEHITTRLPYNGGDPHSIPDAFGLQKSHSFREIQFLIHTRVRIIQSQIHGVQFFDQPLPNNAKDYEAWVQQTTGLIESIVNQATADGAARSWLLSAAQQCQLLLHRPCSRNIVISESSLVAAVTASTQLITSYMRTVQAGGFVMAFELANSAFQAGMVLLYALHNHATELRQTTLLNSGHESLGVLLQLLNMLSTRWPAVSDTAHYMRELIDTCLRNPIGHDGSAYDMNVLEELDCLVTQRRIHSIYHRNIVFPPPHKHGPQSDTASQASEGFLDDENWWRAFINDDFEMDGDPLLTSSLEAGTIKPQSRTTPQEPRNTHETKTTNTIDELDGILEALPSCSFCRDRRIKCHQQLPACRECLRMSRECVIFDPIVDGNIPLRRIGFLIESIRQLAETRPPVMAMPALRQPTWSDQIVLLPLKSGKQGSRQQPLQTLLFGPWSSLGFLRRCIGQRESLKTPQSIRQAIQFSAHAIESTNTPDTTLPPISIATSLFQLFARSTNVFYRVLEQSTLDEILSQCYGNDRKDMQDYTHEVFYLVLAIASLIGKRNEPSLAAHAESYFAAATSAMSTSCDHSSRHANVFLLQRTLLICVFLLLSPGSGDIWRHLGFAIRHFFDLAHRPSMEEDRYHDILCTLTRTLYCLESQVAIAFGRPSLLSIGDDLRQELTKGTTENLEEQVSIFSYLISLQMMQIHSALLRYNAEPEHPEPDSKRTSADSLEYRRGLDEWFVRWKELLASLPDGESKLKLLSWGQFNYYHGVFLVSLLWPTPGGKTSILCGAMADAGLQLVRHQQLFAQPYSATGETKPPLVCPMTWTSSHAVLKVGLCAIATAALTTDEEVERSLSLSRCSSLIMLLEADADNLLTGMSLVCDEMRLRN